jgi:hypothetical protein
MSEIDQLIEEVGAADFWPLTEEKRKDRIESDIFDYDEDADTAMSLEQAMRFSDAAKRDVFGTSFESDEEAFSTIAKVGSAWESVEFRFSGQIDEYGYLDTVYLCYDSMDDEQADAFEEYCVVHFKNKVSHDPERDKGICPFCDDRITVDVEKYGIDGLYRNNAEDPNLWAAPTEFSFTEYPQFGRAVRLWWD